MVDVNAKVILDDSRKLASFRLKADQLNVWEVMNQCLTAGNEVDKVSVLCV